MDGEKTVFVHLFIYFTIHSLICSYNDYIKPLGWSKMHLNGKGRLNRSRLWNGSEKKKSLKVVTASFLLFCIQLFLSVQTLSLRGHWRSSLLLRVKQLSKLITNVLNPDFTVGLIPANPSIGAARSPEVLKSWVKNQLDWKLFSLLVSRKIVIVSFETKFLLRKICLFQGWFCVLSHISRKYQKHEKLLWEQVDLSVCFEVWIWDGLSCSEDCFIVVRPTWFLD